MKRILFGTFVLSLILFAGCSLLESKPAQLTIVNNTSYDIRGVNWTDYSSNKYDLGSDTVYYGYSSTPTKGIKKGGSYTTNVMPGSAPIYFTFANSSVTSYWYKTDTFYVGSGETKSYTFSDSTTVYYASSEDSNTLVISEIKPK